jgi:hypothetical protein
VVRFDPKSGLIFLSDDKGDYLRTTRDGGSTWSELRSMPSAGPKFAADFIDVDHGWRAYDLTAPGRAKGPASLKVARTTDGGKTWHDATAFSSGIQTQAGEYNNVTIHFRDRSNGVLLITFSSGLVGGNGVQNWPPYFCGELTTSDGGATWSAPKNGRCLVRPTFVSDLMGYAEIMDGGWGYTYFPPATQALTMDGGRTWTEAQFPKGWGSEGWTAQFLFMQRRSDGTLRALCACGPQEPDSVFLNPRVISSNDGGKTWTLVGMSFGFGWGAYWVGAAGEDRWLSKAEPAETLEVSNDGGLTWLLLSPAGLLDGDLPSEVAMWSNGWAVTSGVPCISPGNVDGCPVTPTHLYVTDDGGRTLRLIPTP